MGFFDRGKAPAAKAASTPTKGNKGEGDPVNGYPFGSTTPGYIDYRDIGANGDFFPGTRRQMYRDDPNARKRHTPGSDRYHQVEDWIADGNPTGRDNLGGGSRGGTSRTSSGSSGNRGEGDPVNGYPFGSTTPGYIDYRDIEANGPFYPGTTRQRYQDDPNARKLHTPGSDRQSQVDKYFGREDRYGKKRPEEPWSWTAEDEANDQAAQAQRRADDDAGWRKRGYAGSDWWKSDPEYQQLLASGNEKGAYRRKDALLSKAKDDIALKAFIAQGGTEETYRNRFNRDWPKPRSPLGAYSHGPGSADWDTRFTNPVPPNTAGGGRSGGGATATTMEARGALPDWAQGRGNGLANIAGYLGSGGMTEDLPPGASFDMPSNNILSALSTLSGTLGGGRAAVDTAYRPGRDGPAGNFLGMGNDPGFGKTPVSKPPTSKPASAPRGIRRGGGRVD